jgi:CRISPR-associated endonuclease Cas2
VIGICCYDITDNRRRERVAQTLIRRGFFRVQRSCFIGEATAAKIDSVFEEARRKMEGKDSLLILAVEGGAKIKHCGLLVDLDLATGRRKYHVV